MHEIVIVDGMILSRTHGPGIVLVDSMIFYHALRDVSIGNLQMGDMCTASIADFTPAQGPFGPKRYPPVAYLNTPLNHLPFDQKLMLVARVCNITMVKTGQPVCPSWALPEQGGNWEEG